LKKLIYGICLGVLLSAYSQAQEVTGTKVEVLTKSSASWDGSALPAYPTGTPEITILKITIPPGTQLALHKHPFINAGMLLEGALTVTTEEHKVFHLKKGESMVEVVNKWHYGRNEGTTPAVILVFYAGEKGVPVTVTK